jgi:hypothetical protein
MSFHDLFPATTWLWRKLRSRPARRVVSVIGACVMAVVLVMNCRAHRAMVEARQYVSDASRLHIGVSGSREFVRIHEKYSHYAEMDSNCNPAQCVAKFKFDNGVPFGIFGARSAILYSGLTLSHGSITRSVIGSFCYGSSWGPFLAHTEELLPNPLTFAGPFREGRNFSSDKVEHITFELTPGASPEQRARAYAFNVSFLDRFRACNDATDMH